MRLTLIVVLAGALAGCAVVLLRPTPASVDDYPAAHVRVYRLGPRTCRAEVVTPTETITIGAAVCAVVPQRIR